MKHDHEAVRTLAIQIGVRPAARQLGLNEDRVRQWSKREQWFKLPQQPPQQGDVTTVTKPGDVMLKTLQDDSNASKIGFSRAARKVAEHAASLKASGIYKRSRNIKDMAAVAGQVHGWDSESRQPGILNVQVLAGQAAVQIVQGKDAEDT